jgi:multiple sugar transport system substrate-binding protein
MTVKGKIYGLPDDGDVFVLYYRKDIFGDPANQAEFKAKHGYDLAPPKTWKQFAEIGQFLTDKYAPKMYGAAFFRQAPYAMFMFQERFRNEGGRFFDPNTMRATINSPVGVQVFAGMRGDNKFMPPGVEQWGFVENLAAFLSGQTAMTISWPPYGRWAAGYGTDQKGWNGCRSRRSPARSATPCRLAAVRSSPPASACRSPRPASRRTPPTCSSSG